MRESSARTSDSQKSIDERVEALRWHRHLAARLRTRICRWRGRVSFSAKFGESSSSLVIESFRSVLSRILFGSLKFVQNFSSSRLFGAYWSATARLNSRFDNDSPFDSTIIIVSHPSNVSIQILYLWLDLEFFIASSSLNLSHAMVKYTEVSWVFLFSGVKNRNSVRLSHI